MKSRIKISTEFLALILAFFCLGAATPENSEDFASSGTDFDISVINKADSLRLLNKSIAPEESAAGCAAGCGKPKVAKYDLCTDKNNYLEKEISAQLSSDSSGVIATLLKDSGEAKIIKDICFTTSLNTSGGPFKYCGAKDSGAPQKSVPRACISEKYTQLTRASFEKVAECLGDYLSEQKGTASDGAVNKLHLSKSAEESMLSMFQLMSWESGLHVNARAKVIRNKAGKIIAGGSGGTGQLTQGAIDSVNRNELARMKTHLATKGASCGVLQTALEAPMKSKFSQSCDRLSLSSGNPMKNMAYAIAYQKQSRRFIRASRIDSATFKDVFAGLDGNDRDYLERNLAMWAHNSGDYPIQKGLQSYLRHNPTARLNSKDDVDKMLKTLVGYMGPYVKNRYNPNEPLKFYEKIQNRFKQIEKNAGEGSCLIK